LHLVKVQIDNLTLPSSPLYEDLLHTQIFPLQNQLDFPVQLPLLHKQHPNQLILTLQKQLSKFHQPFTNL
ncbi:DUF1507 family protein, partial [Staphylococcus epidermidis]|uniref:DUF1507 family protein n=1 Tax=Staphylococcus epidermidis TaxID=1282 RepID=UPI00119D36C3